MESHSHTPPPLSLQPNKTACNTITNPAVNTTFHLLFLLLFYLHLHRHSSSSSPPPPPPRPPPGCFHHELHFPELQDQWAPSLTRRLKGARPAQEVVFLLIQNTTHMFYAIILEVPQIKVIAINGGIWR